MNHDPSLFQRRDDGAEEDDDRDGALVFGERFDDEESFETQPAAVLASSLRKGEVIGIGDGDLWGGTVHFRGDQKIIFLITGSHYSNVRSNFLTTNGD